MGGAVRIAVWSADGLRMDNERHMESERQMDNERQMDHRTMGGEE